MSPQIAPTTGTRTTTPGSTEAQPAPEAPTFGPPSDPLDYQAPVEGATRLFVKGAGDTRAVDTNDIRQGHMGDCYFVGALGAVAKEEPGVIREMIHENRDAAGNVASYTVDLYERSPPFNQLTKVPVTVDAKEFSGGAAGFGDTDGAGQREIWVKVVEKAYAKLEGGYPKIGHGGTAGAALEALTGLPAKECLPEAYGFDQLRRDLGEKRPVCFSMATPEGDAKATPSQARLGLRGDHCYSVVDCGVLDGRQMVRLSNPWGSHQPGANGWIAFEDLMKDQNVAGVAVSGDTAFGGIVDALRNPLKA
jgi:hypothetical protein